MKQALTEREIIAILTERFDSIPHLPLGFEDDVSGYPLKRDELIVLKSDMLVGSTDVPPGMSLRQAARKAIVATVSDFAAKGVQPFGLLIALGLTYPVKGATAKELARGLSDGADEYGCRIIGGDTSQSNDLIIDCVGFGLAEGRKVIRRNGARIGDFVAVTGDFGRTAAGLRILMRARKHLSQRELSLTRSVLHPRAQLRAGLSLARSGFVTSSIDSSDGLAWSLHEIARLSRVNILLEKVPVARTVESFASESRLDPHELALYGGEEYELVLTVKPEKFAIAKRIVPTLRRIGTVEKGNGEVRALINGRIVGVKPRGYQHFSQD